MKMPGVLESYRLQLLPPPLRRPLCSPVPPPWNQAAPWWRHLVARKEPWGCYPLISHFPFLSVDTWFCSYFHFSWPVIPTSSKLLFFYTYTSFLIPFCLPDFATNLRKLYFVILLFMEFKKCKEYNSLDFLQIFLVKIPHSKPRVGVLKVLPSTLQILYQSSAPTTEQIKI